MRKRFPKKSTVRTTSSLLENHAFIAPKGNQDARRPDTPGLVMEYLGDTYLIVHEDVENLAVYEECELLSEPNAYWKISYPRSGTLYYKEIATYEEAREMIDEELAGVDVSIEGPFYSDKELQEGPEKIKTIFEHLTNDNDILQ